MECSLLSLVYDREMGSMRILLISPAAVVDTIFQDHRQYNRINITSPIFLLIAYFCRITF